MTELKLFTIAWRNLWRQKRRSFLTLSSIAFGLFFAVMMTAMQDASFADFIDTAAKIGSGHVTIQHSEYADAPSLKRTVDGTDELRTDAAGTLHVDQAVERTVGQTMLSTARDSYGAFFVAYDPAVETNDTFDFGTIEDGKMFDNSDDKGIILGSVLAKNLDAEIGDRVVFTLTDKNGEIVTAMERLRGTVSSGSPSLDAGLCLLALGTLRETLGYDPTEATQVAVFLSDSRKSLDVATSLRPTVGAEQAVLTWDEIQPELRAFVAMKVGGARFMEIIIGLLVAAGIFNTMFMSVMERGREFGVMMAIGWSPAQLFRMVMWEAASLAVLGLAIGAGFTFPLYRYLASNGIDMTDVYASQPGAQVDIGGVGFDPILQVGIFPENAVIIGVSVVIATLAAGIYPAWKAGRVDPVQSINLV